MPRGGIVAIAMQGKEYSGELTGTVFRICFVAAMAGFLLGYDLGGVTSMPAFMEKFYPRLYGEEKVKIGSPNHDSSKLNSLMQQVFMYPLYAAAFLTPMYAALLLQTTQHVGRIFSLLSGGFLFIVGAILSASAINLSMLCFARTLLGYGVGCLHLSVPVYLSEMAPYKHRGTLNIGFQVMITIGILVANVMNYSTAKIESSWGWRLSLGGAVIP